MGRTRSHSPIRIWARGQTKDYAGYGLYLCHSVLFSKAYARFKIFCSPNFGPIICKPIGNPSENPQGTDIAGSPAIFTVQFQFLV